VTVSPIGLALSATAHADYRWEIGSAYSAGSVDSELKTPNGSTKNDTDTDIYNVGVGYYATPKTTVVAGYKQTNVNNGGDVDSYRVDAKHLWSLSGDGAITAELGYGRTTIKDNDDVDAYLVAGKWYLNKSLSFGLGYENTDWNGYEVNTVSVSSEWFITESFEVSLAYAYENPDDIKVDFGDLGGRSKLEVDTETFTIGALYRF